MDRQSPLEQNTAAAGSKNRLIVGIYTPGKIKPDLQQARLSNTDVVDDDSLKSDCKHITIKSESGIATNRMTRNRTRWNKAAPTA